MDESLVRRLSAICRNMGGSGDVVLTFDATIGRWRASAHVHPGDEGWLHGPSETSAYKAMRTLGALVRNAQQRRAAT